MLGCLVPVLLVMLAYTLVVLVSDGLRAVGEPYPTPTAVVIVLLYITLQFMAAEKRHKKEKG